jgi:hypothetical protein
MTASELPPELWLNDSRCPSGEKRGEPAVTPAGRVISWTWMPPVGFGLGLWGSGSGPSVFDLQAASHRTRATVR